MVTVIKKSTNKKAIKKILKNVKPPKPQKLFKASEFCGKIKYEEDALAIQKRLRDEWQ